VTEEFSLEQHCYPDILYKDFQHVRQLEAKGKVFSKQVAVSTDRQKNSVHAFLCLNFFPPVIFLGALRKKLAFP
jgi:hypothetical protein